MKTLTDIDQLLSWLREHAPQAKLTTDSRSVGHDHQERLTQKRHRPLRRYESQSSA